MRTLTSTSEAYNKRDHTLYSLNGKEPVTKGRLVWSIISLYQELFKPSYEELSQLFNRKLNLLGNTVIDEVNVTQKNYLGIYSHKALPITNMFLRYDSSYIAPIYMPFIVLVILIISYMDFIQIKKKYFNN